jgi:hypothetical protein
MRKPDRTKIRAVATLLLSSDLRLLVRHVSNHADEVDGKIAATDFWRRLAPRLTMHWL